MKQIYAVRGDGLGTRLLTAVYALVLSRQLGMECKVIWPPLGGGGQGFYDSYKLMHPDALREIVAGRFLFVGENNEESGQLVAHFENLGASHPSLYLNYPHLHALTREDIINYCGKYSGLSYDHPSPLLDLMTVDTDFDAACKAAWNQISWSKQVGRAVESISSRFNIGKCIGAHVRRGDVIDLLLRADMEHLENNGMMAILQRYTPLSAYFEQIGTLGSRESVVVCTESSQILEAFNKRYGPDSVISCSDMGLTENQKAAVDLVLLSKSARIVAPTLSFFSHCASVFRRSAES